MNRTQHQQFDAIGDGMRRILLERLRRGPLPVGELAQGLSVSRPAVSQHLKVLKDAGLVSDRADGRMRYYQIDPRGFRSLRAYLDSFWDEALASFQAKLEEK